MNLEMVVGISDGYTITTNGVVSPQNKSVQLELGNRYSEEYKPDILYISNNIRYPREDISDIISPG